MLIAQGFLNWGAWRVFRWGAKGVECSNGAVLYKSGTEITVIRHLMFAKFVDNSTTRICQISK